ncbi:MAG: hypothetical protein Kow00109_24030 [Acidobacteriota bacterium]
MGRNLPKFLLPVFAILSAVFSPAAGVADRPDLGPLQGITRQELTHLVHFLASEELAGRRVGTAGNRAAEAFLAFQLRDLGLQPAPGLDGYYQSFRLYRARLVGANALRLATPDGSFDQAVPVGEQFFPALVSASGEVSGPLVWGTARDILDDHPLPEIQGKILVLPAGGTDSGSSGGEAQNLSREDWRRVMQAISNLGAGGLLLLHQDSSALARNLRRTWPEDAERAPYVLESRLEDIALPVAHVAREVVRPCLASLPEGDPSVPLWEDLPCRGTLTVSVERTPTVVHNVLGYLPGRDPRLAQEVVVVGAHLDHLGRRGEMLYLGADDDASGTAAVLEIAEAFASAPVPPQRSILFSFWNAEENGLLGSRHFVENPPFPLERITAVLQLDMVGRNQEVDDPKDPRFGGLPEQSAAQNAETLHLVGYSRSPELAKIVAEANRAVGLKLLEELDDHPLRLLERSDHWPFLSRGIPALLLTTGLHPDYHTAQDRAEKLDYAKLERITRLAFLAAWRLGEADFKVTGGLAPLPASPRSSDGP